GCLRQKKKFRRENRRFDRLCAQNRETRAGSADLKKRNIFVRDQAIALEDQPRSQVRYAAEARDGVSPTFELLHTLDLFERHQPIGKTVLDTGDGNQVAPGQAAADSNRSTAHGDLRFACDQRLNRGHAAFDKNDVHVESLFFKKLSLFRQPIPRQVSGERAVRSLDLGELGEGRWRDEKLK